MSKKLYAMNNLTDTNQASETPLPEKKGLHISIDLLYETVDLAKEGKND